MRKVITKGIIIGTLLIMVSALTMYLGLAYYYRDGFSYNTWINGVKRLTNRNFKYKIFA